MTIVRFLLASAILLALWSSEAVAQTIEKAEECVSQREQQTAALVAQDWSQLERLARRYINDCEDVFSSKYNSQAHNYLSIALFYLGNFEAALAASETCIGIYYSSSSCHVQKVQSLIELEGFADARPALEIAERLIAYLIETNRKNIRSATESLSRELYQSTHDQLLAEKALLEKLRSHFER